MQPIHLSLAKAWSLKGGREMLAASAIVLAAIWVTGCGGNGDVPSEYRLSVNRLHSLNLGILEYMNDYDDVLPISGKWMDGALPYTKDETLFHSPAIGARGYGYAMNSLVAGQALPQYSDPSTVITLFDSTDLTRNATDSLSTEPSPPRYGSKNTIAYLDGHVQDLNSVDNVPLYTQSQDHLRAVNLGMLMYANDYDSNLPLANQWEVGLLPYVKNEDLFHSPAVQLKNPANYGYAMNAAVAGQLFNNIASPATTLSFFDSTVLTRNATASVTTVPNPPRYGSHNTLGYVDGHIGK